MPDVEALRQAVSAVKNGAVWRGFDGPDGVSKDEALEYAQDLALFVEDLLDNDPRERLRRAFGERTVSGALLTLITRSDRYGPGSDLVNTSYLRILLSAVDDLSAR